MPIDRNELALRVTEREGKKRSVDHFQVREVQGIVLSELATEDNDDILELINTVRREDSEKDLDRPEDIVE
jgi:hypothetical protein